MGSRSLDLNATYVENTSVHILPHTYNIDAEYYRTWLTQMLRGYYVIMLTARPERYRVATLARIEALEGWLPNEAYFNPGGMVAPDAKDMMLRTLVYPKHGKHMIGGNRYVALESNATTRAMYARHGIPAYTQQQVHIAPEIIDDLRML